MPNHYWAQTILWERLTLDNPKSIQVNLALCTHALFPWVMSTELDPYCLIFLKAPFPNVMNLVINNLREIIFLLFSRTLEPKFWYTVLKTTQISSVTTYNYLNTYCEFSFFSQGVYYALPAYHTEMRREWVFKVSL